MEKGKNEKRNRIIRTIDKTPQNRKWLHGMFSNGYFLAQIDCLFWI
jgi:hypothetical protein